MRYSVFLGELFGSFLFIVSAALLFHHERLKKIIHDILENSSILALTGISLTFIGLILVISHNIWNHTWVVIITIVGWSFFLEGLFQLFFPTACIKYVKQLLQHKSYSWIIWTALIVGLYLLYMGFYYIPYVVGIPETQ